MSSPKSFKDLVCGRFRSASVSSSLQIEALEQQCQILRRCLNRFTLETLGQIACLDSGNGMCHLLFKDAPLVAPNSKWDLQTQGIFAGTPFARRTKYQSGETPLYPAAHGVYKTFGLARSGEWLHIEIDFVDVSKDPDSRLYESAVCVRVAESSLSDIVEKTRISLNNIFHVLVLSVGDWVRDRKQLYEDAVNLEKQMMFEFELFSMINNR